MEAGHKVGVMVALLLVGALYERWKATDPFDDNGRRRRLIDQFLISKGKGSVEEPESDLSRPIIWIHIPHEINARWWPSFGSRNTRCTNQPYMQLCMNSIVARCGSTCNVCLIRDEDFASLIPGWDIDLRRLSGNDQTTVRDLAFCTLLSTHGGMLVPPSFACSRDLAELHRQGLATTDMYAVDIPPTKGGGTSPEGALSNDPSPTAPSTRFMGAKRGCAQLEGLGIELARQFVVDRTAQPAFLATPSARILEGVRGGRITLISGRLVGALDADGKRIDPVTLCGTGYVDIAPDSYGLLIPADEILRRVSLRWLPRLSPEQVLQSNSFIGRFLATSSEARG